MAADFWILVTSFFCAGINQAALLPVGNDIRAIRGSNPQKKFLKSEKKACQDLGASARGEFERQMPSFRRSKKIQKSEKKACQVLINLITVLKPNQTNGETNDTKRTKNA